MAREWFCVIQDECEDGSSTIYGVTEDPTGANLAWEKPFKVREVDPNEPDWKKLCEDMNEALSRFKGLKEAVEINYPDEVIIRCEVSVSDIRCMAKVLRRYRKATEGK